MRFVGVTRLGFGLDGAGSFRCGEHLAEIGSRRGNHAEACSTARRLLHKDSERFIGVEWSDEPVRPFETHLLVTVANGKGVLARVASALASGEADITHVDMDDDHAQDSADLRFLVSVRDRLHLEAAIRILKLHF